VAEDFSLEEYEKMDPLVSLEWQGKTLHFHVPTVNVYMRAEGFETKEPDTLEWISGFQSNDVFFDIGANVGMYTIAAASLGAQVYAFEPAFFNYAVLNKNILVNNFMNNAKAYCVALCDNYEWGDLYLHYISAGTSCHSFGEEVDYQLQPKKSKFHQGSISFTIDELIENKSLPVPKHIKIDVDGFEHKIIHGAKNTLQNNSLQSVLIEINTLLDEHLEIIEVMKNFGFSLSDQQVEAAIRKEGPFKGTGNHIFRR
jgi:FkbM family methyltransferase